MTMDENVAKAFRRMEELFPHNLAPMQTIRARLVELEAENERLRGALERSICHHRCARIHPHCQLRLTRDYAPDSRWHWAVTTPDGHIYDISKGPMTFEQALADMQKRGVVALDASDAIWRESHHRITAHLSENGHG
jgi:hypothetical protein